MPRAFLVCIVSAVFLLCGSAVPGAEAQRQAVTASVDLSASRHPVSQGIYGVNGLPTAAMSRYIGSTRMGGGDPTTVYNWHVDADNAGYDWYFSQRPRADEQHNSADYFLLTSLQSNATAFVDISTIGWVARGRDTCYSFPLSTWPSQRAHLGDMGDGYFPNGSTIASLYGPQRHCYVPSTPQDAVDFITHLRQLVGAEAFEAGAVVQFDNEPEWWDVQHEDVHPGPFTYDEVWGMTRDWASAIKAAYPKVRISGGVAGGWYGMWCSALDGAGWHCPEKPGPDYLAHNNTYYFPWLLQQINEHKRQHGVCLIDYLDTHWYPALNGQSSETDPVIQQQLLSQPRNLWDPSYADLTNNINPITKSPAPALFRQMHSWLDEHAPLCPDIAIAVTEYAFGGAKLHTTALALAEVFSIMARERVGVSTLFQTPDSSNAIYYSYMLYADYDHSGSGAITGDSVAANTTADVDLLTVYAQHDEGRQMLFVKLFSKGNVSDVQVAVTVSHLLLNSSTVTGETWELHAAVGGALGITQGATVSMTYKDGVGAFSVTVAPRTAAVVVFRGVRWGREEGEPHRHQRVGRSGGDGGT